MSRPLPSQSTPTNALKTFTITRNPESTDAAVSGIFVLAPGLTIVRVCSELLDENGPDFIAKVRVSSDARENIKRFKLDTSSDGDLTVRYDHRKGSVGHLVTEIDVAQPSQVGTCFAFTAGDVVLKENVMGLPGAQGETDGPSILASRGSRVFLSSPKAELRFYNLAMMCAGSSSVFVQTPRLWLKDTLQVMVAGHGRTQVQADRISCGLVGLMHFGDGHTSLWAANRFHVAAMVALQRGAGLIQVRSPVSAMCPTVILQARHRGIIDVADISSKIAEASFKAPHGGKVLMASPEDEVTYMCKRGLSGLVEYTGTPPPLVYREQANAPGFSVQRMSPDEVERRRHCDLEQIPVPTVESAFERPIALEKPREGWFWPVVLPMTRSFLPF